MAGKEDSNESCSCRVGWSFPNSGDESDDEQGVLSGILFGPR